MKKKINISPSQIVATWRSGSTFMSDFINSNNPRTFYHYEPLHVFGINTFDDSSEAAAGLMQKLIQCDFEQLGESFASLCIQDNVIFNVAFTEYPTLCRK